MRIPLTCMQCLQEQGKPSFLFSLAELHDDGLYWMECPAGHKTVTCLQQHKFEVLFDLAANAIIDGYYREAIASFASCLEDFYEFYVNVICIKHNINQNNYRDTWKETRNQSERQLGAYIFVYLLENNERPRLLNSKKVKFRNDVIHKGKIPSKEEAIEYGQEVLDLIVPVLSKLKEEESEHLTEAVSRHIKETLDKVKGNPHISVMCHATAISIARGKKEPQPTLNDLLTNLSEWRSKIGW